jgi:hypothetical protein
VLVQIWQGTGAGSPWIATRTTRAGGWRSRNAGRALGRYGKDRKLWRQLLAMAFGAFGFVTTKDQRFELVIALFADILENGHKRLLRVISI